MADLGLEWETRSLEANLDFKSLIMSVDATDIDILSEALHYHYY